MKVKIKSEIKNIPKKANSNDAAYDCVAISFTETDDYIEYGLGFSLEIPDDFAGFIYPRSSISKYDLFLCNGVGVIDSGYRDEVKVRFKRCGNKIYEIGDRVCQLIISPTLNVEFENVESLDIDKNRNGGFGSSNLNRDLESERKELSKGLE